MQTFKLWSFECVCVQGTRTSPCPRACVKSRVQNEREKSRVSWNAPIFASGASGSVGDVVGEGRVKCATRSVVMPVLFIDSLQDLPESWHSNAAMTYCNVESKRGRLE